VITVLLLSPALDVTYLVPSVEVGAIHRPREVFRVPGGKGLNLARAAICIGGAVRVIAPIGGHTGADVARLAVAAGVDITSVPVAAETRTCITVAADDDGSLTEFYEPSAALPPDAVADFSRAVAALDDQAPGWTVLAGSVPPGVEADELVALLRGRMEAGDRIAIDTHGQMLAAIVAQLRPAVLKVNRLEAEELVGAVGGAIETLASSLRDLTGGTVVVTDGSAGAVAMDDSEALRVLPLEGVGRYSVGSGDSFFAGLLVALESGAGLRSALVDATAAGAANAAVPGAAEFSLDTWRDIRKLVRVAAL